MNERFKAQGLQAPDGLGLRAGKWDVPEGTEARAVCVLLEGFTEFLEKYGEVAEELNRRGFVVVSIDWRGQGASERGARDVYIGHVGDFAEYELDLAVLFQKLAAPLNLPVIALAHSMGAHILLRELHANQRRFLCAALVAPMIDIIVETPPPWLVNILCRILNLGGASKMPLPETVERDAQTLPFEENRVTSDLERYRSAQSMLKKQPFLRTNGPSFGWLGAALRSISNVNRRSFADEITTPLLVFGASKDRVVKTQAIRDYVSWLPNAEYVELEDSEHEILMEKDFIRNRFWSTFDAFVEKQLAEKQSGFFATRGVKQG